MKYQTKGVALYVEVASYIAIGASAFWISQRMGIPVTAVRAYATTFITSMVMKFGTTRPAVGCKFDHFWYADALDTARGILGSLKGKRGKYR